MKSLTVLLLAGCVATTFTFSPTVTVVSPKPENCKIEVMTSMPSRSFQEIGTLELYNGDPPKTLDAFKAAVAMVPRVVRKRSRSCATARPASSIASFMT